MDNKPAYDHTVKNYQSRRIPICKELLEKMLPFIRKDGLCFPSPNGGPYNCEGPRKTICRILREAKANGHRIGWHTFRHTFATMLAQKGVSLWKIKDWMGHSSITVTEIYAHSSTNYDDDIEKLAMPSSTDQPAAHITGRIESAL